MHVVPCLYTCGLITVLESSGENLEIWNPSLLWAHCRKAPVSLAVMSSCYGNDNSTSPIFLMPFLLIFPQSLAQITATSS